jgi:hypothetical protein
MLAVLEADLMLFCKRKRAIFGSRRVVEVVCNKLEILNSVLIGFVQVDTESYSRSECEFTNVGTSYF